MHYVFAFIFSTSLAVGLPSRAAEVDWLQFGFDSTHSGTNPYETQISRNGVGVLGLSSLYALYHVSLPVDANSAPVLLTNVLTPLGLRDLLFLVTIDGYILARDAADGSAIWSQQPMAPPYGVFDLGFSTSSSPAVDPNRMYVYAYAFDGMIHKWRVGDGTEVVSGGWPEVITLKPQYEKGSAALTIATASSSQTYLYAVTSGFYGDGGDYQGHVTAINLATGSQSVFNALCSDQTVHFTVGGPPDCSSARAGIWGRGGVAYDAKRDRIYITTGNGPFDANTGGHNFGDSVLALSAAGTGVGGLPLDSYTPNEYQNLELEDQDLGSLALAILPALPGSALPHLGVRGGKDGWLRLLNLDDMSGQHGPTHVGGELQKILANLGEASTPQPTVWTDPSNGDVWVIVSNRGYRVTVGAAGTPSLTQVWGNTGDCRTSQVIANDVLFCADSNLRAFDPTTGNLLWEGAYSGGTFLQSPIVANGKIYFTDSSGGGGHLSAYRLGADEIFAYGFDP